MRPRILVTILLTALFVILSGCGTTPNCPTCGTTINGAYAIIDVVPVPEHNSAGEPGGPFNSFDISWIAGPPSGGLSGTHNLDYISDRIGLVVQVIDTTEDLAMFSIQGSNAVSGAGNGASPCAKDPVTGFDLIPPIIDADPGNFTRYGCRSDMSTATPPGPTFHLITGFGANHNFGGFPGAQCCASRGNGVNPMSGPDGLEVSADGNTLFVGNGSASVAVFDLTAMNLGSQTPPTVLADIPTGVSADYDGPQGISGCVASWNGEAGSATDCGETAAPTKCRSTTCIKFSQSLMAIRVCRLSRLSICRTLWARPERRPNSTVRRSTQLWPMVRIRQATAPRLILCRARAPACRRQYNWTRGMGVPSTHPAAFWDKSITTAPEAGHLLELDSPTP